VSRLLITANSPGEIAGWVRPILREWHDRGLGPVDILLLPCSFATGQEERVARTMPGVERVYRPHEYARLWWKGGRDYRDGNLLHLGGDLMYSAFLSWRWKIRSWSYLWARPWWDSAFAGYFTKDDWGVNWLKKRKVSAEKIHLTGDLVLDSVRQHVSQPTLEKKNQISYLPGSRSHEAAGLAPFFLELHRRLQKSHPGLQGYLHLSPFLPEDQLQQLLESDPDPKVGGQKGVLENGVLRHGETQLHIATDRHYQHLSDSSLAISIPGTKTAEAGYLRTPVLTIIPTNRPEHLPSIGLTGLLDFLPGGAKLKGRLLLRFKPTVGLLAHPNILAGRALLPEVVEDLQVEPLARLANNLLTERKKLRDVSESLQALYPWSTKAAAAVVDSIGCLASSRHL
jgi:hypothetical protein